MLDVDKPEVKALGAKWNDAIYQFYIPDNLVPYLFEKWWDQDSGDFREPIEGSWGASSLQ